MRRYDSYKDSGVQWIGEIPSHWEVARLKMLVKEHLMYGANEAAESDNKDFPRYIRITDIDDKGELKDETFKSLEPEKAKDYLLTKGDVLFARSGATVGKTYLFKENYPACFAGYLIKATCNSKLYPSFLLRFTQSGLYNNWKNSIFIQSTIQNIGADKYNELLLTLPSFNEQTAIANYLDNKCAKIDNVIATQEKRVELLRELKQSIITRAVTRGIPSTSSGQAHAKMKDSGVEWIGEIPEHWEVRRLRYLCDMITGDKDTIMRVDDGLYPFYVRSPKIERINSYTFDGEAVLMAGDGVGAGKVIHYANGKFDFHQRVYNFHNFRNILGKFVYYHLLSNFRFKIEEGGAKNTVDSVRLPWLKDFWTPLPPISEQQAIVTYIEQQTSKLDSSITKALRQIELLKEYKQSLITEVVTGKRKVC